MIFWSKTLLAASPICKSLAKSSLVITTVLLGSCVNYLDIYTNKKLAPPAHFQNQKSIPQQHGQWPTTNWANQFGDPQLTALINEALDNNPSLDAAQARLAQAQAMVENKNAPLWPNVSWQGQSSRGLLSANLLPPNLGGGSWYTFSEFLFKLKYDIDLWGKNLATLRQAISEEKASEAANQEARLSIATSVASTYNQLAYYYNLRDVLRRTVVQRRDLEKISAVRLRTGLDTKTQLYQSRNSSATAQTLLTNVEGQIILTRQQLGTLVGGGPDRGLAIKRPRLPSVKTPELPPKLPLDLLGRRPDIVAARWRVEAYYQGIKNAKAQFYPDINLAALGGYLSLSLTKLFESASRQYQMGPAISLPIFDAGALRAQLKGQYAYYEEAIANYNDTLNSALSDVATQITTIDSINKQLGIQKEALRAAEHAYNLAKYQYRIGLSSQLVVLNAEASYLTEQQTRLQLLTNRRNLQIALIKALGGGFDGRLLLQPKKKTVNRCHNPSNKNTRG